MLFPLHAWVTGLRGSEPRICLKPKPAATQTPQACGTRIAWRGADWLPVYSLEHKASSQALAGFPLLPVSLEGEGRLALSLPGFESGVRCLLCLSLGMFLYLPCPPTSFPPLMNGYNNAQLTDNMRVN